MEHKTIGLIPMILEELTNPLVGFLSSIIGSFLSIEYLFSGGIQITFSLPTLIFLTAITSMLIILSVLKKEGYVLTIELVKA
jgi:hypothetical protein